MSGRFDAQPFPPLVEREDRRLVVCRPPQGQFEEGEEGYLTIEPEYCMLLEG